MEIKILPMSLANMIAAGEVVGRPSAVVKELMENAVDAGADEISVVIKDAGRTLIQVIDNGCGMTPDQAVLCFERHATSKIASQDDLGNIHTFGFRGEALASIAAVSEVVLRTRTAENKVGCEVSYSAAGQDSVREVATPVGSAFEVRNLFYNVPARRKFLKSDNVEFKHIVEEFIRVALTRPEIQFRLFHNDRPIYVLGTAQSHKFRITDLIGGRVVNGLVGISADTTVGKIKGYIGRPDTARKTLGNQYFFVNGRYFRCPYLHKAVMTAYEGLIPSGATPAYFIYMDVNPETVDINISPTKTEVKFEDEQVLFQVLLASVKKILGKHSFAGSLDFNMEGAPELPVLGQEFIDKHPLAPPTHDFDPGYNPFDLAGTRGSGLDFPNNGADFSSGIETVSSVTTGMASSSMGNLPGDAQTAMFGNMHGSVGSPALDSSQMSRTVPSRLGYKQPQDYSKLFDDRGFTAPKLLIIDGKYIIVPSRSGMMLINVKRARERILYDKFIEAVSKNEHVTQVALFPVQVQVGVENKLLFDEHSKMLSALGFDIVPFSNDTIVVNGVPEGFSAEQGKVEVMISDLIFILSDRAVSVPGMMQSSIAERFALLGATGGDKLTSVTEADKIVDLLLSAESPELTNSGHRIITMLSIEDIDNMFR